MGEAGASSLAIRSSPAPPSYSPSRARPVRSGGGGNCPRRCVSRQVSIVKVPAIGAAISKGNTPTTRAKAQLAKEAPNMKPTVSRTVTQEPHKSALLAGGRACAGTVGRGGPGRASPAGRSAVSASRSAYVRAASTRPIRRSNSSLVSRPCTNAALRVSTTCSRSACDVRRCPRSTAPAAVGSPGAASLPALPRAQLTEILALLLPEDSRQTSARIQHGLPHTAAGRAVKDPGAIATRMCRWTRGAGLHAGRGGQARPRRWWSRQAR